MSLKQFATLTSDPKHFPRFIGTCDIDWSYLNNLSFKDDENYHLITGGKRQHHPIGKELTYTKYGGYDPHRTIDIPKFIDIEIPRETASIVNSVCDEWNISAVYKYSEDERESPHRVSYPYPSTRYIVSNVDVIITTCLKRYYIKRNNIIKVLGDALHVINSVDDVERLLLCCWNLKEK